MICACCGKEIEWDEDAELISCDGDFIHKSCRAKWDEFCNKINNMSDEEFSDWLTGKDEEK